MVSFNKICPCICDHPQPPKSAILDLDPAHFEFKGGTLYIYTGEIGVPLAPKQPWSTLQYQPCFWNLS